MPPARYQVVEAEPDYVDEADQSGLLEYWQIVCRYKGTIVLIAVLGALAGFVYSLPQVPVYQARTSLEIQGLNENFLNMANVNPTTNGYGYLPEYDIQTQLRIIQSQMMRERALGSFKAEQHAEVTAPLDRLSAWRKALGLETPGPAERAQQALGMAAGSAQARASNLTRIVEILCDSTDPGVAADYANTLANEFITQNLEARWNSTQRTGEWLTGQMQELRIKLEKSEDQLQAYARASGLLFTSEKDNVVEEKLKQLQQELSKAQSERITKESQYEMAMSSPPEALPDVLDSDSLREYEVKLTDLRRQLAELGSTLTPAHPKVKRLEVQMTELDSSIKKERGNILRRIRNEFESAQRRERLLATVYASQAKLVSEQAGKAIHYNILKREVDTNRQLYEAVLQKVKEAGIASAMRANNVRVIDPARAPGGPYRPNPMVNSMMGLLSGVFLGMVFVLLRERADRSFRAPGDAAFCLKMPELGVIPSNRSDSPKRPYGSREVAPAEAGNGAANGKKGGSANGNSGGRVELATWEHKPSLLAESFRATLASILFSGQNGNRPRVIVLTSPSPSEGKTTTVSNLAIALAEINRRVLLIDADMRKPRLHDVFDVPNTWGLSDLLREKNSIEECPREALVRDTTIPGLHLLPSGPGTVSISNLLYSPRMPELLRRFRREFDTILIDTPPMLQISDARVLGRLSDAVVLVFRANRTTRDSALAAKHRFAEDGTRVLGSILNHWNPIASRYGYGYGYGYDSYSSYYGGSGKRK